MQFNSNIPLQARGPNVLANLARSTQAASAHNQVLRQNQLAQIQQEHGAGILAGDANALNALAGVDVQGAMQIKGQQQQMRIQEERLRMARAAAARAASNQASRMNAQQAAAEAAQLERAVAGAMGANSQEQLDGFLQSVAPDLVGTITMDNRDLYAAQALGVKDALEMAQGPEPLSSLGKIQADIDAGLLPEGTPLRSERQSETIFDSEGNVILQRGETPPKLTVDAGKNTGFYIRTQDAHNTITELESEGLNFIEQNVDRLPLGTGNFLRSPEFQRFDQARRDFVNAILRRESGAVISDSEFDNANKQYFPQPGDNPEVIEQKRRNRANAIEGLRVGSGAGAGFVDRQNARAAAQAQAPTGDLPPAPEGFSAEEWQQFWGAMTPEEQALFR